MKKEETDFDFQAALKAIQNGRPLLDRGVEDILIACIDGLKGFPEAIESIFPKTEVQLCIVHQIRNSQNHWSVWTEIRKPL